MERRELVGGGLVASLAALAAPERAEAAAAGAEDEEIARVARSLEELRRVYEQQVQAPNVDELRRQQRAFLKSHQKYPDFVEVGADVWEAVYFWHVKHQQPIVARMMADGRYAITFMFTTVVLRADQPDSYVGYPYDASEPRK
jgi:cystathionine beta-lyase family protein involved in aluminum resistance